MDEDLMAETLRRRADRELQTKLARALSALAAALVSDEQGALGAFEAATLTGIFNRRVILAAIAGQEALPGAPQWKSLDAEERQVLATSLDAAFMDALGLVVDADSDVSAQEWQDRMRRGFAAHRATYDQARRAISARLGGRSERRKG
jgi:hypothetical protein